jgi:hypothetical protein
MDAAIESAIADKKCPGGVLWLEHDGAAYHRRRLSRRRARKPCSPIPARLSATAT